MAVRSPLRVWKRADPRPILYGGQESAPRVEARLGPGLEPAQLPQGVGTREGCVATEIDLELGREPTQVVPVAVLEQERRLREVHLACNLLHPTIALRLRQETDARGVSRERLGSEWMRHVQSAG
jgi:hypothetical protein